MSAAITQYQECPKQIDSVATFIDLVREEDRRTKPHLIFRGQQKDWSLLPKVRRFEWHGEMFNLEQLILNEFRRVTPSVAEVEMRGSWDVISVAQHHGLPTRLLDWTYSAAAALWFAVKDGPAPDGGDGVVWILKTTLNDFDIPSDLPLMIGETKLFRPRFIATRIQAQSSLFSVHAPSICAGRRDFIALEKDTGFASRLIRVRIAADIFGELREQLSLLGVNDATMRPDLDGICKHLEWEYTKKPLSGVMRDSSPATLSQ